MVVKLWNWIQDPLITSTGWVTRRSFQRVVLFNKPEHQRWCEFTHMGEITEWHWITCFFSLHYQSNIFSKNASSVSIYPQEPRWKPCESLDKKVMCRTINLPTKTPSSGPVSLTCINSAVCWSGLHKPECVCECVCASVPSVFSGGCLMFTFKPVPIPCVGAAC